MSRTTTPATQLPKQLLAEDAFLVRGGVELSFVSTTLDASTDVWRKVFVKRIEAPPSHFLLMDETRRVLDEPNEGVAKGMILDSDEDHNLFSEFDLYYKSEASATSSVAVPTVAVPVAELVAEEVNEV